MKKNSIWNQLYSSLKGVWPAIIFLTGPLTILAGFILSDNHDTVSLKIALPVFFVLIAATIILGNLSWKLHAKASGQSPEVIGCHDVPYLYPEAKGTLLLEPCDIYGHDSIVSIYYLNEECERLIGIGFVEIIQEKGRIQIVAYSIESAYDQEWQRIIQNDKRILCNLVIKPSFPKRLIPIEDFFRRTRE